MNFVFTLLLRHLISAFLLGVICVQLKAQTVDFQGFVRDSATQEVLTGVNVYILGQQKGTSTNENGFFSLLTNPRDTLIFSLVGYKRTELVLDTNYNSMLQVLLSQVDFVLKPMTVTDKLKLRISFSEENAAGSVKWLYSVKEDPFAASKSKYVPGHIGPGVRINGLLTRFSKSEKEKRALERYKTKKAATKVYERFVNSEALATELKSLFKLQDHEYNAKLELFNRDFPEAALLTVEAEIRSLIIHFFASKNID